jgi:hypothetical protein
MGMTAQLDKSRLRRTGVERRSAFQELFDAALQLALFLFASAQPFRKVGAGQFG